MGKWLKRLGVVAAAFAVLLMAVVHFWAIPKVEQTIKEQLPVPLRVQQVRWEWPSNLILENVFMEDQTKDQPYLLKAESIRVKIPLWGCWIRPLPIYLEMSKPQLKVSSTNMDQLFGQMSIKPQDWLFIPFAGLEVDEVENPGEPLVIPLGVEARGARVEIVEEEIRKGQPVFIADHVDLSMQLSSILQGPILRLASYGYFVDLEGNIIGMNQVDIRAHPKERKLEGVMRIRHEQIGDFKNLYQYAPRPVYIMSGGADFFMDFTLEDATHLALNARCLVEDLDLAGNVGDAKWEDIMPAVEDDQKRYEWTVTAEGKLDDPYFDPHDYVLSAVEWEMKELASLRGLRIKEQMFFYSDTPEPEEEFIFSGEAA